MKKTTLALAFVLTTATLAHALRQTPWVKVAPPAGHFSVIMPTKPEESVETKDSQLGNYTAHLFISKTNEVTFVVGWVDYAPNINLDVRGEIDANRDNFLKGVKAKLISERKIEIDGHPGIEFMSESEGHIYRTKVYLVGKRPYMMSAVWLKGQPEPVAVQMFLTSFRLEGMRR